MSWTRSLLAAGAMAAFVNPAMACPFCRVAGDDLGTSSMVDSLLESASTTQSTTQNAGNSPTGPRFGFAVDFASANFHHGYMLQDSGLVFQPTISISPQPIIRGEWKYEPYLVWVNTFQTDNSPGYAGGHGGHTRTEQQYQQYLAEPHEGTPFPHYHSRLVDVISYEGAGQGWFESEVKPGVRFSRGPLALDLAIDAHFYPSDFHDLIIEAKAKVTYDLASIWSDEQYPTFDVRAIGIISQELKDDNGAEDTIFELGLEPIWRFDVRSKRGSIQMPVMVGLSPNGYYLDSDLTDAHVGYVSLGVELSVPMPVDAKYGRWYFNAGVTGYQMIADSAEFANNGSQGLSTHVGIGIAF